MSASGFLLLILAASLSCGDSRFVLEPFSFAKQKPQDVCPECRQIMQLSTNMIFSRDTKVIVFKGLHALCQRLPKQQASGCVSQVQAYLPNILQHKSGKQKQDKICEDLRLCPSPKETSSSALSTATNTQEAVFNPVCTLCLMVIRKIESLLPKNRTEETIKTVMEEVCQLVPESYKEKCNNFVKKYGVDIVEFLLMSAAPHTVCMLLHLCLFDTQPVPAAFPEVGLTSDCESCRTLAALSRIQLGLNATERQTSVFLQSVCIDHPKAIHKCEAFTRTYGQQLQRLLGKQIDEPHVCEKADLCVSVKQMEPLGRNPCTRGPSYWCKDAQTAHECGNHLFCETYVWKKN